MAPCQGCHLKQELLQRAAIAPGAGVGLHRAGRLASRWRLQTRVLVACKVGTAHSLAALTSCVHDYCSCWLSGVDVAIVAAVAVVAAVAAVAIAAAGLVASS